MQNPWLRIELSAYEQHMCAEEVGQLQALSAIMAEQLAYKKETVTLLGAAGGNGLEHIDPTVTHKVYAIDINDAYLAQCKKRHSALDNILETIQCDLSAPDVRIPACGLLLCNMVVEYLGVDAFCALLKRNQDGLDIVSCVIQKNNGAGFVGTSRTAQKLKCLDALHTNIDEDELISCLNGIDMEPIKRRVYDLPGSKQFIALDFANLI